MTILLTHKETEEFFFNALCNGLYYFQQYGLEVDCGAQDYKEAKARLQSRTPDNVICYEDIFMEVLRGGGQLQVVDHENDGEWNRTIGLQEVHDRVSKTPANHLMDMIEERDDADTADAILQTVFFEDIIFG